MDGISFDATEFISSPFFWRALLLLVALWTLKNMPTILDNLRYVFDKSAELLTNRSKQKHQYDQVIVETLKQKLDNGDPYDASFVVTLYQNLIEELRERNRTLENRLQAMTNLAIKKSDESTRIVGLLNGTISMFNTVAERLTDSINHLNATIERFNGHG